jgi:hypothetical protein
MGWPSMLLVAERLMNGEIITIFILCFDVSFKYTLHLLNFEGYMKFNGLIDSTQVQLGRGSSSRSSGGSTHHRRTEQDIANEKMEQRLRENEEYNL